MMADPTELDRFDLDPSDLEATDADEPSYDPADVPSLSVYKWLIDRWYFP